MALNNKEEGRNQFRLQYCPQPWRFLNLLSLKEELVSRGLHTGGARKALELRIAQYEERGKHKLLWSVVPQLLSEGVFFVTFDD